MSGESAGPERGPEFVPDDRGGVTVVVDGHPQSHVCPGDPGLLVFEYVAHMAAAVDTLRPGRLAVTHVGGAGLTLARYVHHSRPGSPQVVLEPDAALTEAVRRELPLPRGHRVRVRPAPGREGMAALRDGSADVVVLDAYAGGQVPPELTTTEFLRDVARVLAPDGVLLANVADEPGLRFVARVAAGARAALGHVALVATHDVLRGKRFGNAVLLASRERPDEGALRRRVAREPFPTSVLGEVDTTRRLAGGRPLTDADPSRSPAPPDPGRWRVR